MEAPDTTLTLTKIEGATRQTNAAIEAFLCGHFDIAITLAGAAEGMLERDGPHMFSFLRDSPSIRDQGVGMKEWIAALNLERDWLKHSGGAETLVIERGHAAMMIVRAASKLSTWTPKMEEFKVWLLNNIDSL